MQLLLYASEKNRLKENEPIKEEMKWNVQYVKKRKRSFIAYVKIVKKQKDYKEKQMLNTMNGKCKMKRSDILGYYTDENYAIYGNTGIGYNDEPKLKIDRKKKAEMQKL